MFRILKRIFHAFDFISLNPDIARAETRIMSYRAEERMEEKALCDNGWKRLCDRSVTESELLRVCDEIQCS